LGLDFSVLTLAFAAEALARDAAWVESKSGESMAPSSLEENAPGELGSISVSDSGERDEDIISGELKNAAESTGEVAPAPRLFRLTLAAAAATLALALATAFALARAQRKAASWV